MGNEIGVMNQRLTNFLTLAYRRDVLGHPVVAELDADLVPEARAELARIKAIPHVESRDFAAHKARQAIERALTELEHRHATGQ